MGKQNMIFFMVEGLLRKLCCSCLHQVLVDFLEPMGLVELAGLGLAMAGKVQ